ncbi:MAG: hypothetical protein FJ144_20080 [Deltaproteobacteria bacterium]|nr:hypothetical protein [Deltaproteobacteria bacterium]
MASATYRTFEPLLQSEEARDIVALCERFGSYGLYSEEGLNEGIGEGLPQRFDAAFNFIRTGGRFGRREDLHSLAARTNYFRETYAYGEDVRAPGIEPFLHYEGFVDAAREIHGRPVVEPAIVYANLLLPGQELAVHTDVPEFRGISRKLHPQWLCVVMHHSGLFDRWRMPIATAVSWYQDSRGGAFAFYPDGAEGEPVAHAVRYNTAVILDTDTVFHGVDRVHSPDDVAPPFRPGMRVHSEGAGTGRWQVRDGDSVIGRYGWDEMRFSISWKAYCFRDEEERRSWREKCDDLSLDFVLDALEKDLRNRGRITGERPASRELAELLVETYVHFPPARPAAEAMSAS